MRLVQTAQQLREIVAAAPAATGCKCGVGACEGWTSVAQERWPAQQLHQIATLRDPDLYEPTFEEWHLAGSRYDSPNAPIAPRFFPYNRCELWHCGQCQRLLLRYTEFGGYYVDARARTVNPDLITDGPQPAGSTVI